MKCSGRGLQYHRVLSRSSYQPQEALLSHFMGGETEALRGGCAQSHRVRRRHNDPAGGAALQPSQHWPPGSSAWGFHTGFCHRVLYSGKINLRWVPMPMRSKKRCLLGVREQTVCPMAFPILHVHLAPKPTTTGVQLLASLLLPGPGAARLPKVCRQCPWHPPPFPRLTCHPSPSQPPASGYRTIRPCPCASSILYS